MEGLVLNKFPYGERHLICHLLLRSGSKISTLFLGGRGGGKKLKPGVLELGYLIKVELRQTRSTVALSVAKEWSPQWAHQNIRRSYQAFQLMCFYLELVAKIATEEDLFLPFVELNGNEKTFAALANGVFYLDQKASSNRLCLSFEASLFLSKLLIALGVFPTLRACIFCGNGLSADSVVAFISEQGGFACIKCCPHRHSSEGVLWQFLTQIGESSYKELSATGKMGAFRPKLLLSYFCYQFHLDKGRMKTGDIFD